MWQAVKGSGTVTFDLMQQQQQFSPIFFGGDFSNVFARTSKCDMTIEV